MASLRLNRSVIPKRSYRYLVIITLGICVSGGVFAENIDDISIYENTVPKIIVKTPDAIYQIPKNYIIGLIAPGPNQPNIQFSLQVLLPDLQPRLPSNSALFDTPVHGQKLTANVEFGALYDEPTTVLTRMLGLRHSSIDQYTVTSFGYRFYHLSHGAGSAELYAKYRNDGTIFYFTCVAENEVPSPSCSVMENIGDNRRIQYYFSRKYISDAYQNDENLISLINSFRVKN